MKSFFKKDRGVKLKLEDMITFKIMAIEENQKILNAMMEEIQALATDIKEISKKTKEDKDKLKSLLSMQFFGEDTDEEIELTKKSIVRQYKRVDVLIRNREELDIQIKEQQVIVDALKLEYNSLVGGSSEVSEEKIESGYDSFFGKVSFLDSTYDFGNAELVDSKNEESERFIVKESTYKMASIDGSERDVTLSLTFKKENGYLLLEEYTSSDDGVKSKMDKSFGSIMIDSGLGSGSTVKPLSNTKILVLAKDLSCGRYIEKVENIFIWQPVVPFRISLTQEEWNKAYSGAIGSRRVCSEEEMESFLKKII